MSWDPIILTFQLACVTTVCLLIVSVPIAYWLAFTSSRMKPVMESVVSLPLVLPPTVIGFYLLLLWSPSSGLGKILNDTLGVQLVFSFPGLVLASMLYSLPFMVHPLQNGFASVPKILQDAAYTMGKTRWQIIRSILLPNMKPAIGTALVLSFAHTIGEFGVVLMIGGSIPGETKVASIAIYEMVEALQYDAAHTYSLILLVFCFVVLFLVYMANHGSFKRFWS